MLVALPSAIAYGVASYSPLGAGSAAAGAMAGILGTVAMGIVAPLLGGAPRLISAPCAPAAAVMAAVAASLLGGGATTEQVLGLLVMVALMSGGLQVLYGLVGGGKLIKYIPYPVVSGYLSGVAVIIFTSQLPRFVGLPKGVAVVHGLLSPSMWRWQGMVVGAVTIAVTFLAPRITRAIPGPVLGLAGGVVVYFGIGAFDHSLLQLEHNPLLIGPVAAGGGTFFSGLAGSWRAMASLQLERMGSLLVPALTLSALLSIDTLKTCVVVDALTRSRHRSNRELFGQGIANLTSALVGGMPGAGTMGATLVNVNSGGRTRLSGVLEGVFALVALVVFSRLIGWVPLGALAGILIVVAYRMFDRSTFHLLRQRSTVVDFVVIAAVIATAVGYSLVAAAGVGLALAMLLFVREQMRSSVIRRKVHGDQISSKRQRLPVEKELLIEAGKSITVCELQGSLFFGTTDRLFTDLEQDLRQARFLILDLRRVQSVDFTGAHMLEQFEAMLSEREGELVLSSLPAQLPSGRDLASYFRQLGVVRASKNVRVFDTVDDALEWAEDRLLEDVRASVVEEGRPLPLHQFELMRELEEDGVLQALAAAVGERTAKAGELIFCAGDDGHELYLVRRGSVRIHVPLEGGKQLSLATYGRGHVFGEMAFLDRRKRSADAQALVETDLYVIPRASFDEVVRSQMLVGVKVFARLARLLAIRLRHTDAELRALHDA